MKKKLSRLRIKNISELSVWTLICGFSCVAAVFFTALFIFGDSVYISSSMVGLGLRMIAQTVLLAAIVDLLCSNIPEE